MNKSLMLVVAALIPFQAQAEIGDE